MNRIRRGFLLLVFPDRSAVRLLTTLILLSGTAFAGDVIEVRLRPLVLVPDRDIRLSDIAGISDSSIGRIDIAKIAAGKQHVVIDKSTVGIRLRLHGLRPEEFMLKGPDQMIASLRPATDGRAKPIPQPMLRPVPKRNPKTALKPTGKTNDPSMNLLSMATLPAVRSSTVSRSIKDTSPDDASIERAVKESLAEQFGIPVLDLQTRMLRPLSNTDLTAVAAANRIETLAPAQLPLGRSTLTVQFWKDRRLLAGKTLQLDVRRRQAILVTRRPILRGRPVLSTDVRSEIRWMDQPQDSLQIADLNQMIAKRNIRPGELLQMDHFESQKPADQRTAQVIRSRDAVRIVGHRKGLEFVVPNAEAMEAGRVGQMIRVRNVQSKKIIIARVVGPGEVQVTLE